MIQSKLSIHDKITLTISNMKVTDIPTQNSRVFIRLMQYHTKRKTKPTQIIDNSVQWDDEINLKCILPKKNKKMNQKFLLNISIRLEDPSGRGFVRYGNVDIDVSVLKTTKEFHIELPIQQCIENSKFSADIINEDPLNDENKANESKMHNDPAKNESLTPDHNSLSSFSMSTTDRKYIDQSISETSQSTDFGDDFSYSLLSNQNEVSITVFENVEVKIKEPKMKELENQVDNIIAQIINNSY